MPRTKTVVPYVTHQTSVLGKGQYFYSILPLRCLRHRYLCGVQHILNKYSITPCRVVYKHVRDSTDNFPVLNNGASTHECC